MFVGTSTLGSDTGTGDVITGERWASGSGKGAGAAGGGTLGRMPGVSETEGAERHGEGCQQPWRKR